MNVSEQSSYIIVVEYVRDVVADGVDITDDSKTLAGALKVGPPSPSLSGSLLSGALVSL